MSAKRRSAAAHRQGRTRPAGKDSRRGVPGPRLGGGRPGRARGRASLVLTLPARRAAGGGKVKGRTSLLDETKAALHELRTAFDSVLNHYRLRVAARLAHVEDSLGQLLIDGALTKDQQRDLDQMKSQMTDLDLQPQKGRRRDIRKIARIALRLEQIVDGWE